jgi:hypothetical protein
VLSFMAWTESPILSNTVLSFMVRSESMLSFRTRARSESRCFHLRLGVKLCAIIHCMESAFQRYHSWLKMNFVLCFSLMAWSESCHYHSWLRLNLRASIHDMEGFSVLPFMAWSETQRYHSWLRVNLCAIVHDMG